METSTVNSTICYRRRLGTRGKLMSNLAICLLLGIFAVVADPAHAKRKKEAEKEVDPLAEVQCKGGLKPRIAVFRFHATGKLGAYEGYNVGEGLAAQLATERALRLGLRYAHFFEKFIDRV